MRRLLKGLAGLAVVIVLGVGALLGFLWLNHRREVVLPPPTGPSTVGRAIQDWTDPVATDSLAPVPGTKRVLLLWIDCGRRLWSLSSDRTRVVILQERRLDGEQWIALSLDGKRFAEDTLVIAVGVTRTGMKVPLGFVQTATENRATCAGFLRRLIERGFTPADGLLVVLDGAMLRAAVEGVGRARPGAALSVAQAGERRGAFA